MRRRAIVLAALAALSLSTVACGGRGADLGTRATQGTTAAQAAPGSAPRDLGFPLAATKNTTRVGGADPVANAAAVARAVYPGPSAATRPGAVAVVDARDWRNGIAAAVLASPPVRAPLLLSVGQLLPGTSVDALAALAPTGARQAGGAQIIRVGDAARPPGLRTADIRGANPFALARAVDAFSAATRGRTSDQVMIASADDPAYAMPAAAWAAKSGDPVLFVRRDAVPGDTRAALLAHQQPRIYVVGPREAVSDKVVRGLRLFGRVTRVGAGDAARSSVDFARFLDGPFGWGVVDPGHGLLFARGDRPLDAAAAAPLSASGTYGPLLVLSDADRLDGPVAAYLLDIEPGYTKDPVRGVYNHGWLLGDATAISAAVQSRIDQLLEITRVSRGPKRASS